MKGSSIASPNAWPEGRAPADLEGAAAASRPGRLNRAPIFVNAFWRGGSNILFNLLLSHPDLCSPTGELHRVFRGGARGERLPQILYKRLRYQLPVLVSAGPRFFRFSNLDARPRLPERLMRHIDRVLYDEKLKARHEQHNLYIREGVRYSDGEIGAARLVCKNLNGVVFLTDLFATMYPDATFFGLIRNGFALCEGFVRRGLSPEECARTYVRVAEKMLADAERIERYHILRFDEIIKDPGAAVSQLYHQSGLDSSKVDRIRLQHKATLDRSGRHRLEGGEDRELAWYPRDRFGEHLRGDIDDIQVERLGQDSRERFLAIAGPVMQRLGYA